MKSNQQQIANVPNGSLANSDAFTLTTEQIQTLVSAAIIPQGTPVAQIEVFQQFCAATGLNPFTRQCYLMKFGSGNGARFLNFTGIEGLRAIAARSGVHAGTSDAMYNMERNGNYSTAYEIKKAGQHRPISCTVTVKKIMHGVMVEFTHTILVDEFYGQSSRNPLKQSLVFQLAFKCAESYALKKAFPEEMANVYVPEQAEYIEGKTESANTPNAADINPANVEIKFDAEIQTADAVEIITDEPDESRALFLEHWKGKLKECTTFALLDVMLKKDVEPYKAIKSDKDVMNLIVQWKAYLNKIVNAQKSTK